MMRLRINVALALLLFILLVTVKVSGQDAIQCLKEYKGHAIYKYEKYTGASEYAQQYTVDEETLMKGKLEALSNYLLKNQLISSPKGNELLLTSRLSDKPTLKWVNSLLAEIDIILSPWHMKNGKPACDCNLCKTGFSIKVNNPSMVFNGRTPADSEEICDKNGLVYYLEPGLIGEQYGCKLYDNGIVLITNGKPIYSQVTVKEFDEALIRKMEKEVKNRPDEVFLFNQMMNMLKDEMASFSNTELNAPAFRANNIGGSPSRSERGMEPAIVKLNPAYFDMNKPPTSIQLIVVECGNIQSSETGEFYFTDEYSSFAAIKLAELMKSLRYSEFKKFLD